mmetsp:Transcript_65994/g.166362  ORF Transcript_65994/g.166362 Transcript_65994/m.166362 type:complete len:315 (-) Transcript_65994:71-1015(-)
MVRLAGRILCLARSVLLPHGATLALVLATPSGLPLRPLLHRGVAIHLVVLVLVLGSTVFGNFLLALGHRLLSLVLLVHNNLRGMLLRGSTGAGSLLLRGSAGAGSLLPSIEAGLVILLALLLVLVGRSPSKVLLLLGLGPRGALVLAGLFRRALGRRLAFVVVVASSSLAWRILLRLITALGSCATLKRLLLCLLGRFLLRPTVVGACSRAADLPMIVGLCLLGCILPRPSVVGACSRAADILIIAGLGLLLLLLRATDVLLAAAPLLLVVGPHRLPLGERVIAIEGFSLRRRSSNCCCGALFACTLRRALCRG